MFSCDPIKVSYEWLFFPWTIKNHNSDLECSRSMLIPMLEKKELHLEEFNSQKYLKQLLYIYTFFLIM